MLIYIVTVKSDAFSLLGDGPTRKMTMRTSSKKTGRLYESSWATGATIRRSRLVGTAMNNLYRHELRTFQNFFQPSVKLIKKVRIGSRLQRVYDAPKTPWPRVLESQATDPLKVGGLKALCARQDPFELSETIDRKLQTLSEMTSSVAVSKRARRASPGTVSATRARAKTNGVAAETRARAAAYPDLHADPLAKLQRVWEREVRLGTTGSAEG